MDFEKLIDKYQVNEPIFAYELLKANKTTKANLFRRINKAVEQNKIIKFSPGVYYIPKKTVLGYSTISSFDVVKKKYITNGNEIYGFKTGLSLLNSLGLSTQVPNEIEIVTNNETTRVRKINVNGFTYILRSSRLLISKDNVKAYMILELFTIYDEMMIIDNKEKIKKYILENNLSSKIKEFIRYFPNKTAKRILISEVLS